MSLISETQTVVAQKLIESNPDLARASAPRLQMKAGRAVGFVIGLTVSGALLVAGGFVCYRFAMSAIEQKQALSISLMLSLLIPLIPAGALGLFTAFRHDPDAGSAIQQVIATVGSLRDTIRGKSP